MYENVKYPYDQLPDGYSIFKHPPGRWSYGCLTFEYRISICKGVRWMSKVHLTTSQMNIQYSNIQCPSDDLTDGY